VRGSAPRSTTGRSFRRHASRRRALVGVAIVGVLVVGGVFAWRLERPASTSTAHPHTRQSASRATRPTATTTPACDASAAIARWPLQQRLAQLLMVGATPVDAHEVLAQDDVGGIFITTDTAGQLAPDGGTSLDSTARVPPFVALDEEGGRVQRIALLIGAIPSARQMAATMTPAQVQQLAAQRAQALRRYGVTMDLAPVADVSSQPDNGEIGDRSFSSDPAVVTRYAQAFARGLQSGGVVPILKHFPGLGHATGDSDTGVAIAPPLTALETSDLVPYQTLLALPGPLGVMVGHATVPGLTTSATPASLNPAAINGLLRTNLKYNGFVITDSLGAGAITMDHTLPDATVQAIEAGADMALFTSDDQVPAVLAALTTAVQSNALSQTALNSHVERILALKGFNPC
jgi:beta-N-acetylhexosaminidase